MKEYTQSVVIPDEAQLRELYYNVDTRSVSLLQTKAEIVNTIALNERNHQSRDFEKIMKFKKVHDICADIGAVLADLMVLLNNWKSLLTSIGGYQYVKDLKGRQKALYEHIKKTVLNLIKKRRTLLEQFEAELTVQYNKVYSCLLILFGVSFLCGAHTSFTCSTDFLGFNFNMLFNHFCQIICR